MKYGESAEETLQREIIEETGLNVKRISILDTWNLLKQDCQITGIIYLCKTEKNEVVLSDEHDHYTWLPAHERSIDKMHKAFKERMIKWNWDEILQKR